MNTLYHNKHWTKCNQTAIMDTDFCLLPSVQKEKYSIYSSTDGPEEWKEVLLVR